MSRMVAVHGSAREMMIMAIRYLAEEDEIDLDGKFILTSYYEETKKVLTEMDDFTLTEIYNKLYDKVYSA